MFKHLKKYPWKLTFTIIFPIVDVLVFIFPITITANIVDQLISNDVANLFYDLGIILFFAFLQTIIFFTLSYTNDILGSRVITDITQELFETVQSKSLSYIDSKDIGQVLSRATGDTRTIKTVLSPGLIRIISVFTIWIVAIFLSLTINIWLVVLTVFFFLFYVASFYHFARNRVLISQHVLENYSDLTEITLNSMYGVREIKNLVAEDEISEDFNKINNIYMKSVINESDASAWFYPALIAKFYSILMITISLYLTFIGSISFGQVILITGVIVYLGGYSAHVKWMAKYLIASVVATERIYRLINEIDPYPIISGKEDFPSGPVNINFENVSFRYSSSSPFILHNISFEIKENQIIAIIGKPGSGKSTLSKLIQGLYVPEIGKILINNIDISNFNRASLHNHVASVEQDIFLFNTSILENIRFGKPTAAKEEIVTAAKLANAHDFIQDFPNKYETIIGEKGVRLSGGQAQRIAIARALIVNPSILLLDDAASSLDAKTELQIQNAISEILETRTTIITTHRLGIIAKADQILILDEGKLVGYGNHGDLIRNNLHYRSLFEFHYELPDLEVEL